ncbi:MAG: hypothetical protein ABFS86_13970 [Planctomycetota bacterium]
MTIGTEDEELLLRRAEENDRLPIGPNVLLEDFAIRADASHVSVRIPPSAPGHTVQVAFCIAWSSSLAHEDLTWRAVQPIANRWLNEVGIH